MGKTKSKHVKHLRIVEHHGGIGKKNHKSTRKRRSSGSHRDYRKSVSNSLVYRSVKIDNDGYIGFKVTYSGKGTGGNYDRSHLSIVLIPDIHFIRAYRPLAGAIARETKGEVIVCTYSAQAGYNERLVSVIVNRTRYVKSKLRKVNIVSENEGVLELFKKRLAEIDELTEKVPMNSVDDSAAAFEDAASSPNAIPVKVTTREKEGKKRRSSRVVQLIRIRRREDKKEGAGSFSSLVRSLVKRVGSFFSNSRSEKTVDLSRSVFEVIEKRFKVNEKLNLSNANHCDIIAKEMLSRKHV